MENFFNSTSQFFAAVPDRMIRIRWPVLIALIALSAFMLVGAVTRSSINTAANSFLDQNDPAILALNTFRDQFGSDDSVVLVYRAKDGDVFSKQSLAAVQALTKDLENWRELKPSIFADAKGKALKSDELQHLRRVQSLSTLRVQAAEGDTLTSSRLVPRELPDDSDALAQIKTTANTKPDFKRAFFSEDGRYAAILVQTDFGSKPSKDFVPAIADDSVALDASFGETTDAAGDLTVDHSAEVQSVTYEKVDNFVYANFVKAVKAIYAPYEDRLEFYPVGLPPLMEFVQQVLAQSASLNLAMILINVVLLWALFRSLSAVFWPIITIVLSIVWTVGATAWLGQSLSTMISLTIMLVFVCGMADCIHVISLYINQRREGAMHRRALSNAYAETGLPMLITSFTNMVGTLSLMTSEFYPIRVFAGMSTVGVGLAFLFTMVLLPILLDFWHPEIIKKSRPGFMQKFSAFFSTRWQSLPSNVRRWAWVFGFGLLLAALGWRAGGFIALVACAAMLVRAYQEPLLNAIPRFVARSYVFIFLGFGFLVGACWYGESQIRVDSNIMELTREGSSIRTAFATADEHLAGTQSMEIMIDTKVTDGVLDTVILGKIDHLQQAFSQQYPKQVSRTYSLANIVKDTNKVLHEDKQDYYRIPDSSQMVSQLLYLFNSVNPADRRSIVSDDYSKTHISVNVYSAGSQQYQAFFTEVNQQLDKEFADTKARYPNLKVTLTGTVPLAMRTQAIIANSQYDSFLMALAVISVIIFLTLGSIQAGLLSLIPNIIPALFTYGLMGLLDIPLDTDTLLLAPVIIGLAVDDTIHFMTHYRLSLMKTRDMAESLKHTIIDVGPSVLFTGMIVGLGFSVQIFSDYLGTAKMGLFGGLAIFVGILCELLLLPALLLFFKPKFGLKEVRSELMPSRFGG
jgi:predicted RND superfamily exporter protein